MQAQIIDAFSMKKKKPKTRFLYLGVRIPLLWCTTHNLIRILKKSIGLGYFLCRFLVVAVPYNAVILPL